MHHLTKKLQNIKIIKTVINKQSKKFHQSDVTDYAHQLLKNTKIAEKLMFIILNAAFTAAIRRRNDNFWQSNKLKKRL